jgi:hypothetical protein
MFYTFNLTAAHPIENQGVRALRWTLLCLCLNVWFRGGLGPFHGFVDSCPIVLSISSFLLFSFLSNKYIIDLNMISYLILICRIAHAEILPIFVR